MKGKYLWWIGKFSTIALTLLGIYLIVEFFGFLELLDVYRHIEFIPFWAGLPAAFLLIVYIWYRIGEKWRPWALEEVRPEDKEWLISKIVHKDSFVMEPFSEWKKKNKLFFASGIALFTSALMAITIYKDHKAELFNEIKEETIATIIGFEKKVKRKQVELIARYEFEVDGKTIEGRKSLCRGYFLDSSDEIGFDILEGDSFEVEYNPYNLEVSKLITQEPVGITKERIFRMVEGGLEKRFNDALDLRCIIDGSFQEFGMKSLAILANSSQSYLVNRKYNSMRYHFFSQRSGFQSLLKKCEH